MKFEPEFFLRMAQRNGLMLTRIGDDIHIKKGSLIWITVIKRHKRRLLKYLPEDDIKSIQVDLFDDV